MNNRFVGRKLKRDLYNKQGIVLFSEGTVLTAEKTELLARHHIVLDDKDTEADKSPPGRNERLIAKAAEEIRDIFNTIRTKKRIPLRDVREHILPTVSHAAEDPNLFSILSGLQAKDDYKYRHNIGVAVISSLIGKWLHLDVNALSELTLAAILHDVGKIYIDNDILNKPGRYTEEEFEIMKRHTVYGCEIIRSDRKMSERIALVALQHHERENGRGYPHGITGKQMDDFSKIVAVADIFHAMTSNRVYRKAIPFYQVIREMRQDSYGALDPHVTRIFVQRIMEMSVGSRVRLTDGRIGKVVMIDTTTPESPLIKIGNRYLDLGKETKVQIETLLS